jgi:hypothetical protein
MNNKLTAFENNRKVCVKILVLLVTNMVVFSAYAGMDRNPAEAYVYGINTHGTNTHGTNTDGANTDGTNAHGTNAHRIYVHGTYAYSVHGTYAYGTKSVYQPRATLKQYQPVPQGYSLVFTELVARHGSRALSSPKYDDISLKIWKKAQSLQAIQPMGFKLGSQIERLMQVNQAMGYGNLSQRGREEHYNIGRRLGMRDRGLFELAVQQQQPIIVEYSGKTRAKDSALSLTQGLIETDSQLTPLIGSPQENKAELYFHKAKINEAYQQYKENDPQLRDTLERLFDAPQSHRVARAVLSRIYSPAFVQALAQGEYQFIRQGEEESKVYNDVDAVIQLFNLYLIAPGLAYEAGDRPWGFRQYFTPRETQWLSYLLDAKAFYEKGPSFAETQITYQMAKVLEDDFFNSIRAVQYGTNNMAAKLRFAHAETIIPFAALMQLKGSTISVPSGEVYTRRNNPWRGEWVSPYSANIQWDVYRNQADQYLVRMLYNEQEIKFKSGCRPISKGSFYYRFDELERCYEEG